MTDAPTTPDPIEIAMEAEASGVAPLGVAARVLAEQERLIGWEIADKRAGFVLKVLTGIAGVAVAFVLALMAWQASRADGLLIKPFSVPPELAARGVTGEALASQMLDQLSRMAATAHGSMNLGRISADRGDSVSIEIPQTGVSLSQLDQWLRDKLGHQVRVTGEVMTQPDGSLRLLARVGSDPLPAQAGGPGDVEALVVRAAESIYGRQQPISYVQYLERTGRLDEALAVERANLENPERTTRAMAWSLYGRSIGRVEGVAAAAAAFRRSRAIDLAASPGASSNLAGIESNAGHAELAYQLRVQAGWAAAHSTHRSLEAKRNNEFSGRAGLASSLGDAPSWLAAARGLAQGNAEGMATDVTPAGVRAQVSGPLLAMHQLSDAAAVFEEARLAQPTPLGAVMPLGRATTTIALARAAEDWPGAAAACDAADASVAAASQGRGPPLPVIAGCAVARARAGRLAEAEAALGAMPLDCQPCVLARAQLAELKGDRAHADHWFAEAVRMAPSLPQANHEWARALLARGQPDAAITQAREALRRGPRYADAMEAWGEALAAKGDVRGALAKFAAANRLTPKWGRLHLKWGEALAKLGKADEARAQWRLAAGMDLTAAERAELQGVMR